MHSQNIAHRDLKLENVLIDPKSEQVKIIDFGFSVHCKNDEGGLQQVLGTPCYMSPEIIDKKTYDPFKVDVWALGVLFYRILVGTYPFQGTPPISPCQAKTSAPSSSVSKRAFS